MAENDTDDKKSAAKEARLKRKSDERWLKKRIEMLERAVAKEEENRQNAIDDLKFSHGEQWDESEKDKRSKKKRPALTMNLLPPYINQLVGDQRQNRPRVKLRPVDSEASVQSAKIREGIIWNIEYLSNADSIYDQAFEMMLRSGYGAWRILTRYTEENPFLQEIYLEGIDNPLSAYLDPLCDDMVGSTADYGFILSKMSYDEFKETFPGQKLPTDTIINDLGISNAHWYDDDSVTIVEWYEKEYVDQEFCSMKDGRVIYKEQADEEIAQFNKAQKLITTNAPNMLNPNVEPPEILETKTAKITKVRQWKFTASSVLEGPNDFPGKFIPIILLYGPRINIEGKSFVRSFIHYAIDAQKMVNFWSCLDVNTPIPTPSGWTTMGQIKENDMVFGDDGLPTRVVGVSPVHSNRKCFKITFSDKNSIIADESHLWSIEERIGNRPDKWEKKIVRTSELNDERQFIYNTLPLTLPESDLPIHPYVLGIWLGDGDSKSGRITVANSDLNDLCHTLDDLGIDIGGITTDKKRNTSAVRIVGLTSLIKKNNLYGNKHIPDIYLRSSFQQRLQLLQGLMDTDGSITKTFNCAFNNTNINIIIGLEELLHSLGLRFATMFRKARLAFFKTYFSECKDSYQVNFTAPCNMDVFRLRRKLEVQHRKLPEKCEPRRTQRRKIIAVERVPSVPVKCIKVDNASSLFLAGIGMIPTHNTAAAERISLEPKAPWIITAQQIAGHEKEFASANTDNLPYLLYNHIDGQNPPQRQGAGTFPQALFMEIEKAESNLQKILGMFNADVGAPGSERSGAAILARQRPGDVGSFMYVDNLHRSIMHSAYVINSMIPEVYDSDRDVRIRNYDDSFAFTPINTSVGNAMNRVKKNPDIYQGTDTGDLEKKYKEDEGPTQKYNDITSGKYDIVITVGPSYSTQRQEAAQSIMELIQYAPQLAPLLGDLAVKSMDFLYADEAAERLEKTLPYGVKRLKPGEQPPPPPEPNPTEQAKLIQAQSLLEKAKAEKERATASIMDVKVKQLRLAKEIADTQGSMRKMVMEILAELFMPNHPADTGNALQMHTTVPLVKPPKKRKG